MAVILNDKELVRLLTHLGLPDEDCQLDPLVDYEAVEPAPADD